MVGVDGGEEHGLHSLVGHEIPVLAVLMNVVVLLLIAYGVISSSSVHFVPKYGVKVTKDKNTDFGRLKTYTWTTGWTAFDKEIDRQVVAAVDRELASCGFTKVAGEPSDVLVRYASLVRTDVDLKSKVSPDTKLRREYRVGTVTVFVLNPRTSQELFRARVDMPLATDPSRLASQFDGAVAQMFAKYPTRSGMGR
jgi:hypothetical protein